MNKIELQNIYKILTYYSHNFGLSNGITELIKTQKKNFVEKFHKIY